MTLRTENGQSFGDNHEDLRAEILDYSQVNKLPAVHFVDVVCSCSNRTFHLYSDDNEGAAVRVCAACGSDHYICDSEEYIEDAELGKGICTCGTEVFEMTVAVALFRESNHVRWIYVGCRCTACGLMGVYTDWKVEFDDYKLYLAMA